VDDLRGGPLMSITISASSRIVILTSEMGLTLDQGRALRVHHCLSWAGAVSGCGRSVLDVGGGNVQTHASLPDGRELLLPPTTAGNHSPGRYGERRADGRAV
jgi:hypothetical protein